ncbi:monocarboxylate transporter 13-like [Branchiostoma lanceolatum]|uniref:monocarboxylate transporter 13-like n=1 Tax=Branchiostoma lanceolatum TaxID=7740 RepID=UPI0034519E35
MPRHRLLKNRRKAVDPPDGGWGWVVALSGAAMLASTFGIIHSMGVFFVPWREQFVGASAAEVALVPSMVMGITNLAAPIASGLGRKFGLRPVIMSGGVLAAAGFCLSRFATHISHLYVTIGCLVGFGNSLGVTNMLISLGRYFTTRRLRANSIATLGGSLGAFAFPPLFQLLIDEYGTKGALLIAGGLVLHTVAFGSLVRPLHLKAEATNITYTERQSIAPDDNAIPIPAPVKEKHRHCCVCSCNMRKRCLPIVDVNLLKEPSFLMFLISVGFVASNRQTSNIYMIPRAKFLGIDDYPAAFLMSTVGIVGIVGRCISGVAPEWERYRRIDQYGTVAVLMGFAMMLVPLATSYGSMVAYSVVFGLLFGALVPITITTAADLVEVEKLPSAMGLRMFVQGVATLVGPAVSGALRDVTGSYDATFLLGGACVLFGGLIPFLLHMRVFTQRKDKQTSKQTMDNDMDDTEAPNDNDPSDRPMIITKETSL